MIQSGETAHSAVLSRIYQYPIGSEWWSLNVFLMRGCYVSFRVNGVPQGGGRASETFAREALAPRTGHLGFPTDGKKLGRGHWWSILLNTAATGQTISLTCNHSLNQATQTVRPRPSLPSARERERERSLAEQFCWWKELCASGKEHGLGGHRGACSKGRRTDDPTDSFHLLLPFPCLLLSPVSPQGAVRTPQGVLPPTSRKIFG